MYNYMIFLIFNTQFDNLYLLIFTFVIGMN